MSRVVDVPARAGDCPTAVQRFQPIHDPAKIFDDGQITARQFAQHAYAILAVVDRLEIIEPQPVGELAGIDLVIPVALVERRVLARVARQHMGYMRFE